MQLGLTHEYQGKPGIILIPCNMIGFVKKVVYIVYLFARTLGTRLDRAKGRKCDLVPELFSTILFGDTERLLSYYLNVARF